jgi:hypothetical protein
MNFMKLKVLLFSFLFIGFYTYAQQTQLIIRGGPNLSYVRGNSLDNDQSLFGFTAGAFARYALNKHTFLSTGIQYERNGFMIPDLTFTDPYGNNLRKGDVYSRFNYLVLPMMAEYGFGSGITFSIKGGPFIGYLLQKRTFIKWDNNQTDDQTFGDSGKHRFNFGLGAGAGAYFPLNKKFLFELNIEDHLGLTNVSGGSLSNGDQKTNALNLTAGLVYSLN